MSPALIVPAAAVAILPITEAAVIAYATPATLTVELPFARNASILV